MEASVIIKDKTHDPFIIFGGLFSRKLVSSILDSVEETHGIFEKAKELKDYILTNKISEERLRQQIAKTLLAGISTSLPASSRGDIYYANTVIEVKNDYEQLDVELIKGSVKNKDSGRIETAVEELFRYLNGKNPIEWGILSTGRIFRVYNKTSEDQFIEFDLFDIIDSGSLNHLYLLRKILVDDSFRNDLLIKTKEIRRVQGKETLFKQFSQLLTEKELINRVEAYPKLVTYLTLLSIRYLEDTGCLPILSLDYKPLSLKHMERFTKEKLLKVINAFQDGKWFNSKPQKLLSEEELKIIQNTLSNEKFVSNLEKLFSEHKNFDYSDIFIDQLGGVYQEVVNKNSEGAYYTPYVIGRKITSYLKSINESQKINFESNESKVIVDIACGSGQLLRALVPYSHLFFKKSDELGKNSVRRKMIARLVGVDKDPNSVFICKISLALYGAEQGLGISMPRLTKKEDTLEAFINSRSNFIEIDRKDIFSIVTNPPWEALEFNPTSLYRKITGNPLPKKSNKSPEAKALTKLCDSWMEKNKPLIQEENNRFEKARELCDRVAAEHLEYFSGKKNTAIYFLFIIQKIIEQSGGTYVVVMPDRFFVGDMTPLREKTFFQYDGYIPFQNCGSVFDGVANGTRFGIIFGRHKKDTSVGNMYLQIPVMGGMIPIDFIERKVSKLDFMISSEETILPFFKSEEELNLITTWLSNRIKLTSWSRGKINLGDRRNYEEYKKIIGPKGKFKFRITKSEKTNKRGINELLGNLNVPFGATIEKLEGSVLPKHYKLEKVIIPNVKSDGIRKIIVGRAKDCIVEKDYNYNDELDVSYDKVLKSFIYNTIVNCMCGSYHVNSGLLNLIGVPSLNVEGKDGFEYEIELLKKMGISEADALKIMFKAVLSDYPVEIKKMAIEELSSKYTNSFRHLDLSFDKDYKVILNERTFFNINSKPKMFDIEETSKLSAYLISNFKDDKNFGRVKFVKTLFLTQHLCEFDLGLDWQREAAGPFNEKDINVVESNLRKEYGIETETKIVGAKKFIRHRPKSNLNKVELVEDIPKDKLKRLKELINIFKPYTTEKMELIATIFGAWNDLLIKGEEVTNNKIFTEVHKKWVTKAKKFSKDRIRQEIEFMKKNGFVPNGFGYPTRD